jgi:hypothetical protein
MEVWAFVFYVHILPFKNIENFHLFCTQFFPEKFCLATGMSIIHAELA